MNRPLRILCTIPGVQCKSVRAVVDVASVTELAIVNPLADEPKCLVTDIAGGQFLVFEPIDNFEALINISEDTWHGFTKPGVGTEVLHCWVQVAALSEIECPDPVQGSILMSVRDVGGTLHQVLESMDAFLGSEDILGEPAPYVETPVEEGSSTPLYVSEPVVETPVEALAAPEAPVAAVEPAPAAEPDLSAMAETPLL